MISAIFNVLKIYKKMLIFFILIISAFLGGERYGFNKANVLCENRRLAHEATEISSRLQAEAQQREEEARRQAVVMEEKRSAVEALALAQHNAAVADRVADQLQQQLQKLQRQVTGSEARNLSETTRLRQAKNEATVLLAELLRESDLQAGNYAKQADESYIAGRNCEIIYERVTTK